VSRIVVGKPTHPAWRDRLRGSLLDKIVRGSGEVDVQIISGEPGPIPPSTIVPVQLTSRWKRASSFISIAGTIGCGTALAGDALVTTTSFSEHGLVEHEREHGEDEPERRHEDDAAAGGVRVVVDVHGDRHRRDRRPDEPEPADDEVERLARPRRSAHETDTGGDGGGQKDAEVEHRDRP